MRCSRRRPAGPLGPLHQGGQHVGVDRGHLSTSRATTAASSPSRGGSASNGVSVKVKNEQHAASASARRCTRPGRSVSPASTSRARDAVSAGCSTARSDAVNSVSKSATRSGCAAVGGVQASTGTQSAGARSGRAVVIGRSMPRR